MSGMGAKRWSALVIGLGLAAAAGAQQMNPIETLRELVAQGQYQRAFELGQAAEERFEGRAEFDFHYGLAALETGHYPEAIFALERVVLLDEEAAPESHACALAQLVLSLLYGGREAAAEAALSRLYRGDDPGAFRDALWAIAEASPFFQRP